MSDVTCVQALEYVESPRPERAHIGLVQLSTDHTLELDWSRLVGDQAAVFSTRIPYTGEMDPDSLMTLSNYIGQASQLIATNLSMDVMAFGCTSASMVLGHDKVSQLLSRGRGAIPTTNPWRSTLSALDYLGVKRLAVLSPYPDSVNQHLLRQLKYHGISCVSLGYFDIKNDTKITHVSAQSILNALEMVLPNTGAQAVFMSCTNLRVLHLIDEIENRYKLPVLSSNSTMFWHAMRLLGRQATCKGYGELLKGKG